jgi:hypothetical protein
MLKPIIAAAAAFALACCSLGAITADKAVAEAAAVRFHHMLDAGDYHGIYQTTAPEFRRLTSEEEFTRLLRAIHERLGAVGQVSDQGWRVNFQSGGNMVSLNYATRFASGRGAENFVFRVEGQTARMAGYHINSTDLVLGPPSGSAKPATGK